MSEIFHSQLEHRGQYDGDRPEIVVEQLTLPADPTGGEHGSPGVQASATPAPSPGRRAVRRFSRNPLAMIALFWLILMLFVAVFASFLEPYDPDAQDFIPLESPSVEHWLGTDDLGRDTLSRLIAGTTVSVRASYQTAAMALVLAIPLGLIAGYLGGKTDNIISRLMDAMLSFPALVLALVIAAILGPGVGNAIIAITIVLIPGLVRIIRGSTLAVTQETYVEASRSIGTHTHVILGRRVFPSVLSPLIVAVTLLLGVALVVEAALSFLGLGAAPPQATWGNMLQRGYGYLYSKPFQIVPPAVAIALAVFAFNIVGDGLRDALGLADTTPPRGSKRGRMGLTLVTRKGREAKRAAKRSAREAVTQVRVDEAPGSAATPAPAPAPAPDGADAPLLSVRNLEVEITSARGPITVVDGVSFDVGPGEVVGLVGESGCGKTVTSLSIMRLMPSPPATVVGGEVWFGGRDLLGLDFGAMADERGDSLAMVFQDPMASLNPAFTIGNQLIEAVRIHQHVSKSVARARAVELLEQVGIPDPAERLDDYPHRLSGGMRQRVLIAMALVNDPKLLIADEPTTALDVTVQAQILDLLRSLQRDRSMSMIFVTHDLGVIADIADRVVVMYAGEIVEQAGVHELFAEPLHPYTQKLMSAIPQATARGERLVSIPGIVPVPGQWETGCRFSPRCDFVTDACRAAPVALTTGADREVRCIRADELATVSPADRADT